MKVFKNRIDVLGDGAVWCVSATTKELLDLGEALEAYIEDLEQKEDEELDERIEYLRSLQSAIYKEMD